MKTSSKIDAILEDISKLVAATLNIDSVSIFTLDEHRKMLQLRSAVGENLDEVLNNTQQMGENVNGWVKLSEEPQSIQNLKQFQIDPDSSFISLPLRLGNELLGVINFNSNKSFDDFSEADFERLVSFSEQVALLIESAELILQAEKKLKGITVIENISQILASDQQDIHKLFADVVTRVNSLIQATRISLLTIDKNHRYLEYEFVSGKKKPGKKKKIPLKGKKFLEEFQDPRQLRTYQLTEIRKFLGAKNVTPPSGSAVVHYFPIYSDNRIWGFFEIWKRKSSAALGVIDVEFLNLISALMSMGIFQKQLYDQVNEMNKVLEERMIVAKEFIHASSEELEGLKNFHETILQNIGSGILTVDNEGIITSLNKSGTDIIGFRPESIIGKKLSEVFGESRAEYILFDSFQKNTPYFKKEINVFRNDGTEIPLGFTTSPMEEKGGKIVGGIILFRDLSEVKHMQAEIRRMDRLVTLGELASGIAHELKNPLAVIGFSLDCLKYPDTKPGEREEFIDAIERNVNRMDLIIKKLLNMGRESKPSFKLQQINKIIESAIMFIKKKCSQNKIEIEKNLNPDIPRIFIDENQLQQVLLNISLNAIQAMESGGILRFSSNVNHTDQSDTPVIQLDISDTGTGIPDAIIDQVFDAFFTTKSDGTGLGLAISRRIIEDHHGTILIKSQASGGTVCSIRIPVLQSG